MKNKAVIIICALLVIAAAVFFLTDYFKKNSKDRAVDLSATPSEEASDNNIQISKKFKFITTPTDELADNNEKIIYILHAPEKAKQGEVFNLAWAVKGVGEIKETDHTAIHYDWASHAGTLETRDGPNKAGYSFLTEEFLGKNQSLPQSFNLGFSADRAGELFFRAHAIIDGKNYWTNEQKIIVQ